MTRVLLVNTNRETAPYPVPPLGLSLVAAGLAKRHEVRVFDATFRSSAELAADAAAFAPEVVGLSIRNIDDLAMFDPTSYVDGIARDLVPPLRALGVPLVLGGSGFSLFPRALLERLGADYGVVGEGERVFPALLDALAAGEEPTHLPGVIGPAGAGSPTPSGAPGPLALPFSRIDTLLDYAPYRQRGSYPIQTKRGCRLRCLYCSYPTIEGRAYRLRSPDDVVDELEDVLARLGPVSIEFVDSTFNAPRGHAESICRAIARRGLKPRLRTMGVNPGHLTSELLDLMRAAGFAQIDCTPDSASPRLLASLRKGFDRAALERAAQQIRDADMPTMWFLLLGGPGETAETLNETFDFVDRFVSPDDLVHVAAGLRIYPHTPLHRHAVERGTVDPADPLLEPAFYVDPDLGRDRLREIVATATAARPNCLPAHESTPPPAMLREALARRQREGLDEPMFRTLLRLRREGW